MLKRPGLQTVLESEVILTLANDQKSQKRYNKNTLIEKKPAERCQKWSNIVKITC